MPSEWLGRDVFEAKSLLWGGRKSSKRRLLPTFKSDKHFHAVVPVAAAVVILSFFYLEKLGAWCRGICWCYKPAGGNLISFLLFTFFVVDFFRSPVRKLKLK